MTLVQAKVQPRTVRSPRRIAVMPAYNEEKTIVSVLERLVPLADNVIVVDDGSQDRTRQLVLAWATERPNVKLICFNENRGMSAAYYRAILEIARRVDTGEVSADDVVITVDADGQHEPEEVDGLVEHFLDSRLDALIARRDLTKYNLYKRAGNFFISAWASLWAGRRLFDVESGYRLFRVGALLSAVRYYKGYRYSETVEVAVVLARLGYRLDNSFVVPVPIFRSNTRLKDLFIDVAAIPAAFWRVTTRRSAPPGLSRKLAHVLPLLLPALLTFMMGDLLIRSLFLADDSMQHYSHVWYLSDQIFHHGRLPLHVDLLDSGRAMTFPYGFSTYLMGAILFPALGDWATTLLLAAGVLGLLWAACLARPGLRDPWFLLLFVINPFFIDCIYSFQLVSVWSQLFFFLFIWQFERKQRLPAIVWLWLALGTHPVMGVFSAGAYGAYLALADRRSLGGYGRVLFASALLSAPFLWMSLQTPALSENSLLKVAGSIADVVARRGTILILPLLLPYMQPFVKRHYLRVLGAFAAVSLVGLGFSLEVYKFGDLNRGNYFGAIHRSTDVYAGFFASPAFEPGRIYRVLEPTEREDGVYRFMRHGAVISNEFFSESFLRKDWSTDGFTCYAAYKQLDFVVLEAAYERRYHKNEGQILDGLAAAGEASLAYVDPAARFRVYDVRGLSARRPAPASLKECPS